MLQPESAPLSEAIRLIPLSLPQSYLDQHNVERPGTLSLSNNQLRISANPNVGGQLEEITLKLGDTWVRVTPSESPAFLMVPYSNRIRDGHFSFGGEEYQLARAEEHSLHGDGRREAWEVVDQSDTKITMSFTSYPSYEKDKGYYHNFPFPYRAVVSYELEGNSLVHTLEIHNLGTIDLPAGGGIHPYLLRALVEGENVELQFAARGEYPTEAGVPLPTGPLMPSSPHSDFSSLKVVEPELDHCYGGWSGKAELYWPEAQLRARIDGSPELKHVVIYAPAVGEEPFFCFEPVTNMIDGLNHLGDSKFDTGVVVLKPGESLKTSYTITFEYPVARSEISR